MAFKFRELNGKKEPEEMGEDNYRERKALVTGIDKEWKAKSSDSVSKSKILHVDDRKTVTIQEAKDTETSYSASTSSTLPDEN